MFHPLRLSAVVVTSHRPFCRAFFTLPNLSPLPFLPDEPKRQTYHERKILPWVTAKPLAVER